MKLGEAVKAMRDEAELTDDQLADKAGTSKASISRIENNKQTPSLDMLERIAAALDVKVYQIFARAEGITLPIAKAAPVERDLIREFRAMEPTVQDHYLAIARGLAKRD